MTEEFNTTDLITRLGHSLIREFKEARQATTSQLIGEAIETPVRKRLEQVLPRGEAVGSGCVSQRELLRRPTPISTAHMYALTARGHTTHRANRLCVPSPATGLFAAAPGSYRTRHRLAYGTPRFTARLPAKSRQTGSVGLKILRCLMPLRIHHSQHLSPGRDVGISSIRHSSKPMRSHARTSNPLARGLHMRTDAKFLMRQCCAQVRSTNTGPATPPLAATVVHEPKHLVLTPTQRTLVPTVTQPREPSVPFVLPLTANGRGRAFRSRLRHRTRSTPPATLWRDFALTNVP